MTPQEFHNTYRSCANQVSVGTNIDPIALLAQWANETAWGTVVVGNNLGNIRCSPTSFCQYANLDEFAAACIGVFHNGLYGPVLAATNAIDQLNAIVASPWSAGHYGGTLMPYYTSLEGFELTPDQSAKLDEMIDLRQALLTGIGTPNPPSAYAPLFEGKIRAIVAAELAKLPSGVEPPEPVEPKTVTLQVPAQTVTGTIT